MFVKRFAAALCTGVVLSTVATTVMAAEKTAPSTHDHSHVPGPSVAIGSQAVGGNVSVVMGLNGFAGGNVGVSSGPDGLLVVDDLVPGFQHKLADVLATMKTCADCGDLKYLINTHWHFDHTGNNEHFGGAAIVIAHDTVRPLLAAPQELKMFKMKFPAKSPAGLPDVSFATEASVHFNGEKIVLRHFPKSHTSGDIAVHFTESNVLHLGDLYFNGMFPVVDLEHGGNVKGMIRSLEAVVQGYGADTKVIPGHGAVSGMKEVQAYLDMLKTTTKTVEQAKKSGMSLEAIQKRGLDKRWKSWAWSFVTPETWIAMIYNSL